MKANILALYGIAFCPPMAEAREATAFAGAHITTPLRIENEAPLNFGTFSPGQGVDGQLTLLESGIDSDGAVTVLSDDQSAARFRVTGADGALYGIELPDQVVLESAGGSRMVAKLLPLSPRILHAGEDTFFVCAKLKVAAQQDLATYSGRFVVTVDYQ